ncbi:ABC transporter ATP-binding protein [Neolewinella agarilytica]|uniref:ABC-type multidrug transport system, ATPase component n=1 Tax=Neolewinella agarilytica TaxID=478744 RepID=A0A1H8ZMZ2_9BACT|nr:ATP-binding cassette domain-containing protein [Neolewinella agarilytica]SEP65697.1 ABC-type multidrug transport system, ATPase component [Neolewinella agarilytica]
MKPGESVTKIHLTLAGVGKRFGRHWILQDINEEFTGGDLIGIKGRNGSGKSTLLRILCGQLTPSRGSLSVEINGKGISTNELYQYVSWAAPYLEIVEELTISEFLAFHFKLKALLPGLTLSEVPAQLGLDHVRKRKLRDCSSGMQQRVLLGSALYADTPLLLLDEPTITLDEEAISWFHQQLRRFRGNRLVFVASNEAGDLQDCQRVLSLNSGI